MSVQSEVQTAPAVERERRHTRGDVARNMLRRSRGTFIFLVSLTVLIAFWQYQQTRVLKVPALYIPPPSAIWQAMVENFQNGKFQSNLAYSLKNYAVGTAAGVIAGIVIGLLMGGSRLFRLVFGPYVWALYSTPRIAFQPIIIVALGFSAFPKMVVIFLGVVFPVIINTMAGMQTVDRSLIKAARVFGASKLQVYTKVALPYTLPFIITGIRLGASRGLLSMYVSEIYGSTEGLGYMVVQATNRFQTEITFAAIIILVVLSVIIIKAIAMVEQRVGRWRTAVRV